MPTTNELRDHYSEQPTERLVTLRNSGTLTEVAASVLEQVLKERGIESASENNRKLGTGADPLQSLPQGKGELLNGTLVTWLNVAMLGLGLIAVGIAFRRHLNSALLSVGLGMIPYALALIAAKSREGIPLTIAGLFANGVWALIGLGGFVYSLGHAVMPVVAAVASLVFAVPACLNLVFFVQVIQRLGAIPATE